MSGWSGRREQLQEGFDVRRWHIYPQHPGLLCTIGGLLGLLLCYAVARLLAAGFGWTIEFSWVLAILAVGCAALIGLVFGIIPAERAARLDPNVVVRSGQLCSARARNSDGALRIPNRNVRFGSFRDIGATLGEVRFVLHSGPMTRGQLTSA